MKDTEELLEVFRRNHGEDTSLQAQLHYLISRRCTDMRMGLSIVDAENLQKILEKADPERKHRWQRLNQHIYEDVAEVLGIEPYPASWSENGST